MNKLPPTDIKICRGYSLFTATQIYVPQVNFLMTTCLSTWIFSFVPQAQHHLTEGQHHFEQSENIIVRLQGTRLTAVSVLDQCNSPRAEAALGEKSFMIFIRYKILIEFENYISLFVFRFFENIVAVQIVQNL